MWTFPSLDLDMSIVAKGCQPKIGDRIARGVDLHETPLLDLQSATVSSLAYRAEGLTQL